MKMPTPFEILNIPTTSSAKEILTAYKNLAFLCHPEREESTEKLKKLDQAFKEIYELKYLEQTKTGERFFELDLNTFSSVLNYVDKSSVSPDDNIRSFLDKNASFSVYARFIMEKLDQKIIEPTEILNGLLGLYTASGQSIFTLWGRTRTHIPFAQQLQNVLKNALQKANEFKETSVENSFAENQLITLQTRQAIRKKALEEVFALLENSEAEFNSQGELIELFNAFFSVFPLYFADLGDCKFKKNINLTLLDDAFVKTIFGNYVELELALTNFSFPERIIPLASLTGQMDKVLLNIMTNLTPEKNSMLRLKYFDSLEVFIPHAQPSDIENTILPFILSELQKKLDHFDFIGRYYSLLSLCVPKVDPLFLTDKVLPTIINSKTPYTEYYFTDVLVKIALRLGKTETETLILPLLFKLLNSDEPGIRAKGYKAISKLLPLINPSFILEKILPKTDHDVNNISVKLEIYNLFKNLMSLYNECAESYSSDLALPKAFKYVKETILQIYDATLHKMNLGHKESFADILNILPLNTLQNEVMPLVLKTVCNLTLALDKARIDELLLLADFPDEVVSLNFKQTIFLKLYERFNREEMQTPLLNVLCKYIKFCENKDMLNTLFTKLSDKVSVKKRASHNSIQRDILQTFTEVVKHLEKEKIQNKLLPFLMNNYDFNSKNSNPEVYELLEVALKNAPSDYIKQTILPNLLQRINFTKEAPAEFFIQAIPSLSYEESIYFTRAILASFEKSELSKPHKIKILYGLYIFHQESIRSHKECVQLERDTREMAKLSFV